jgi:hypothetical protein
MKVVVQAIRQLPEGRGDELGHGHDRFYESSGDTYLIPDNQLPVFYRECYPGYVGDGKVELTFYWVAADDTCRFLTNGTVCRLYTIEGREVGKS